jgi:hypothetical protein
MLLVVAIVLVYNGMFNIGLYCRIAFRYPTIQLIRWDTTSTCRVRVTNCVLVVIEIGTSPLLCDTKKVQ